MKYPAYPKHKDSGVEWLGEVPEHWEVRRLKLLLSDPLKYGANEAAENDDPELPRYVRITDIDENDSLRDDTFRSLPRDMAIPYILRDGDMLFARSGATAGKSFLYKDSWGMCAYAGYLIRARFDNKVMFPKFVRYFTSSVNYWQWISMAIIQATIQNVSAEKYSELLLTVPTFFEQRTIAAFLDAQTSKLDTLIAKKRELIDKLKEKRAALITRTVTRGLPPEAAKAAGLDPHPKMKDSGVEWLGEVPEHWEVKRIKNIVDSIQIGPFGGMLTEVVDSQTGIKLYGQENIISGDFGIGFRWIPESVCYLIHNYEVKPGDVLITRKGSLGHSKIFPANHEIGIIDSDTIRIRVDESVILNKYLQNVLNNSSFTEAQVDMNKRGAILSGVNTAVISGLIMCVPPVEEQDVIIKFLDRETAAIDALVAKVETAIDRLQEYRAALITAAVTGQIDVREAVQ